MSENGNRAKLGRWLPLLVFAPENGDAVPDKVELRHVSVSDKATPVRAWTISGADDSRIKDVCDQIDAASADDADGVGGVQRYAVVATSKGDQIGRLILRYRAEGDTPGDHGEFGDSEPANGKGLAAQAMRHTEAFAKTMAMGAGGTIEQLARMNARLATMVETMMDKHMEHVTLVEELTSNKHARDLETKALEAQSSAKEEVIREVIIPLLPVLQSKFLGITPPGLLPPEVKALRNLATRLNDAQIDGIMSHLSDSQKAELAVILQAGAEGEAATVEAKETKAKEARDKNGA